MKGKIFGILLIGFLGIGGGFFVRHFLENTPASPAAGGTASVADSLTPPPLGPIIEWANASTPATRTVLNDAYAAFFANYATPMPPKPYLTAVSCTAKILDQGLRTLSAEEQDAFAKAYNLFYGTQVPLAELYGFDKKYGTISPAVAAIVREYLAIRLRVETTPEQQSQVLERLIAAAGEKVEVTSFTKKDCAQLPVDAKYK